jgi:hypothetical protein
MSEQIIKVRAWVGKLNLNENLQAWPASSLFLLLNLLGHDTIL